MSGPEESNPIPSYTKVCLPYESGLNLDYLSPRTDPPEKQDRSHRRDYCWVLWHSSSERSEDWQEVLVKQQPIYYKMNQI